MAYVALHFVKVNGRMYTAGEIIDEVIEQEKAERLLRLEAIREEGTVQQEAEPEEAPVTVRKKKESTKAPKARAQKAKAKETREAVTEAEQRADAESAEEAAEADDNAEVPEIDIMEGIVGAKKTRKRAKA